LQLTLSLLTYRRLGGIIGSTLYVPKMVFQAKYGY
jgi:hypothetical protein